MSSRVSATRSLLVVFQIILLVLSAMGPALVSANEPGDESAPPATEQPEATPEATPEPTSAPEATPEPTSAPQATPEPTSAPEATPEPDSAESDAN